MWAQEGREESHELPIISCCKALSQENNKPLGIFVVLGLESWNRIIKSHEVEGNHKDQSLVPGPAQDNSKITPWGFLMRMA